MKKLLFVVLCAVLISGLVLSGCAEPETSPATEPEPTPSTTTEPTPSTTTEPTPSEEQPKSGGILKRGFPQLNITTYGYPPTCTSDASGISFCIEALLGYNENLEIIPRLATDWEVSADSTYITIKLREGVTFHDGSDFNAEVAKWNLDNYRLSDKPGLKSIESVDIIDDYTIQLNMPIYNNLIFTNLAGEAGVMISKEAYETHGQAWCEENPIGAGPLKFVSMEKDVDMVFERFDDYWGGKPYIDGLQLINFADETTLLMAFKRGDIDIMHARNAKDARDLEAEGYRVAACKIAPQPFLAGDSIHPDSPFADIRVRQAMSYAIDIPAICDGLSFGYWTYTNQWAVPETSFYNPDVVGYPYNPEKAKQLLADAGYPDGFDATIYYLQLEQTTAQMTSVQSYLQEVGIRTTLEPHTFDKFAQVGASGVGWENGIYQVFLTPTPDMVYQMNNVIPADQAALRFCSFLRPTEYQELYEKALHATDMETKYALTQELNKMGTDEYCMATWLWIQPTFEIKQPWVHDDKWGEIGDWSYFAAEKAWLSR
jgi:peptide/nickel transport system substrate-binding protein